MNEPLLSSVNIKPCLGLDYTFTKVVCMLLFVGRQPSEGIARMCIRLVTKPSTPTTEDYTHASYDNKLFEVSRSKLLDGAEKTKLITIMSGLEHLVPIM